MYLLKDKWYSEERTGKMEGRQSDGNYERGVKRYK